MDKQWSQWEELGKRWLNGEVTIAEWQGMKFNPKQIAFLNDKSRFPLFAGGMAAGKTTPAVVKLILLSLFFPNNNLLLGRKSRTQVEKTVLRDFFDLAPEGTYEYKVGPGLIKFHNGSEIQLFGLEASASGSDLQGAIAAIRGMNLGGFYIDQLEEIEKEVFEALMARMRRKVPIHQGWATINPANHWALDYFKIHPRENTKLFETSMLDNRANLPKGFIENELLKPKLWVQKNVYGEWTTELLSENTVFSQEYVDEQKVYCEDMLRKLNNIHIFREPDEKHEYQIGVDASDASVDPCAITVVDKNTGEVVATYNEWVPVQQQVETAVWLGYRYNQALIVPESAPSAAGAAFTNEIKRKYNNIYVRKSTNKFDDKESGKLGFMTNHSTKTMLIENFKEQLSKHYPKLRDNRIIQELNTFVYSEEAKQKGAGAQINFHDDMVMATLLAYWEVPPLAVHEISRGKEVFHDLSLYAERYD